MATKNYIKEKQVAEALQKYKDLKTQEKTNYGDKAILDSMFDSDGKKYLEKEKEIIPEKCLEGLTPEQVTNIINLYNRCKSNISTEKKTFNEQVKMAEAYVGELIMENRETDNVKEKTVTFPMIGTVKCTKEMKPKFFIPEEEMVDFIDTLIDSGFTDVLTIDEEKYIRLSEDLKLTTGADLKGITYIPQVTTKITLSRK